MSKKVDYLLPVAVSFLYFFSVKHMIPTYLYLLVALPIAFYFFPIRLLLQNRSAGDLNVKMKVIMAAVNFLFSAILALSIVQLYIEDSAKVSLSISVLAIINVLAAIYYFVREKSSNNFIIHLCFAILTGAISFI